MTTDYSRKWWALAAIGSGTFMSTIDGSIVNIALNTIQETYNASLGDVEWVVLAYLLGIVCLLPSMGRLGDMSSQGIACDNAASFFEVKISAEKNSKTNADGE